MFNLIKKVVLKFIDLKLKNEFDQMKFDKFNERPVEYGFVLNTISKYYPKTVLDVGTGSTAFPHLLRNCGLLVTAVDNIKDYWPSGMHNRHYHIVNDDIVNTKLTSKYDLITCISTLEHIDNFNKAVENMSKLLNPNGLLIITFPSSKFDYVKNCYELNESSYGKGNPYITQSFSTENIENWKNKFNLIELESEYWQFWTGKYWTCENQIIPPIKTDETGNYQIRCICLKKRDL